MSSEELAPARAVENLEHRLARAWADGDRGAIGQMLADDWMTTDIAGRVRSKQQVLQEMFADSQRPIAAMHIDDLDVRVLGRLAVVTGRTEASSAEGFTVSLRFTDVLEQREDGWQFIASQGTSLPYARGGRLEPVLPSHDLEGTRAFYRQLGFASWFNGRWEYEIVSRGALTLHFFPASPSPDRDAGCYWRVDDVDRLHQEFATLGLPTEGMPRLTAPADQPWGMREFTLVDPSGNLIRVGQEFHPRSVQTHRA